jgi:hypothetical protein
MNAPKESVALSYICQLKPRPGSLCLERCVERGVPPGPLLGKLKAGEDIVLSDGTLVKSADVRMPDDPGPIFLGNYSPLLRIIAYCKAWLPYKQKTNSMV